MSKSFIEVREGSSLNHRSGEKNGKKWTMTSQAVFIHTANGEVKRASVNLQDGDKPYGPGRYTLCLDNIDLIRVAKGDRSFEQIGVRFIDLVPLQAAALKAAA